LRNDDFSKNVSCNHGEHDDSTDSEGFAIFPAKPYPNPSESRPEKAVQYPNYCPIFDYIVFNQ